MIRFTFQLFSFSQFGLLWTFLLSRLSRSQHYLLFSNLSWLLPLSPVHIIDHTVKTQCSLPSYESILPHSSPKPTALSTWAYCCWTHDSKTTSCAIIIYLLYTIFQSRKDTIFLCLFPLIWLRSDIEEASDQLKKMYLSDASESVTGFTHHWNLWGLYIIHTIMSCVTQIMWAGRRMEDNPLGNWYWSCLLLQLRWKTGGCSLLQLKKE